MAGYSVQAAPLADTTNALQPLVGGACKEDVRIVRHMQPARTAQSAAPPPTLMFGAGLPAALSSRGQCSCGGFLAMTSVMYRSVVCCRRCRGKETSEDWGNSLAWSNLAQRCRDLAGCKGRMAAPISLGRRNPANVPRLLHTSARHHSRCTGAAVLPTGRAHPRKA